MSKQSSTPKPKRAVAKKTAAKRPRAVVRKTASKKVAQKAPRKTPTKKVAQKKARTSTKKSAGKHASAPKQKTSQTTSGVHSTPTNAEAVTLPTNMSLRQQEKAAVLREAWRTSFLRIAYSAGLCFVVVGAALALTGLLGPSDTITNSQVSAQAISAINDPRNQTSFQLTSRIPDQIDSNQRITFTATNVDKLSAALRPAPCESGFIELPVENLLNGKYRTNVDPKLFTPGYYCLLINIKPSHSSSAFDVLSYGSSKQIQIGPAEFFSEATTGSDVKLELIENTTGSREEGTKEVTPEEPPNTEFAIFSSETTLSGVTTLDLSVPESYESIELYARPLQSPNARFVGLASKRSERFKFIVNTQERLPNGTYEFFAQAKQPSGKVIKTEGLELRIYNSNTSNQQPSDLDSLDGTSRTSTSSNQEVVESEQPVADDQQSDLDTPDEPSRSTTSTSHEAIESALPVANQRPSVDDATINRSTTSSDVPENESARVLTERPFLALEPNTATSTDRARQSLEQNSEELSELLQRYAVAQQAGEERAIELAREELYSFKNEIIDDALSNPELQTTADDLDEELERQIADLSARVARFESLRRERTSGASSVDSDGDGISDSDERTLYQTDPNLADSDNDGFTDGVEILRGFDPNSDTPESVVRLESPRDTVGLERDDAIRVQTVAPVVPLESVPNQPDVKAEVRGTALPNSFVTLYIFSTPIVVTVKTDTDGSFVYTLDKELSDGEHEVFAAVTDNTGAIIAQSRSFPFIKEAQAFTPVDATGAGVVSQQTPIESSGTQAYGTVIGLAILAFGLILIMLGLTLRRTDEPDISTDEQFDIASGRSTPQITKSQS